MKPLHHLLIISIRSAIIVVVAFAMYEMIEKLKKEWATKQSKNACMYFGRFYHMISIFVAEFTIGLIVYWIFNIVH